MSVKPQSSKHERPKSASTAPKHSAKAPEEVKKSDDEQLSWAAMGRYISRQLRAGRGIIFSKFGTFTLTPPEFSVEGVTNPQKRDIQNRAPVFLIARDFVKGDEMRSAIYADGGLRPYDIKGKAGETQQVKANFTEIGFEAGIDKDKAQHAIEKVVKKIADRVRAGESFNYDIPAIGQLIIKGKIAGVHFYSSLREGTKDIMKEQSIAERKAKIEAPTNLNQDNLRKLPTEHPLWTAEERKALISNKTTSFFRVDDDAMAYLKDSLGLDLKKELAKQRPVTAKPGENPIDDDRKSHSTYSLAKSILKPFKAPATVTYKEKVTEEEEEKKELRSISKHSKGAASGRPGSAVVRSKKVTTFAKTVTNDGKSHASAKSSPRKSGGGIGVGGGPNESGMRQIGEWMRKNNIAPDDAFVILSKAAFGAQAGLASKLSEENLKLALTSLGIKLEDFVGRALFSHLDSNHDGVIDLVDWRNRVKEEMNTVNFLRDIILKNKLRVDDVLVKMSLNRNGPALNSAAMAAAINKMDHSVTKDKALKVAELFLKNKGNNAETLSVAEFLTALGFASEVYEEGNWYKYLVNKIRQALLEQNRENPLEKIRKDFEAKDPKNTSSVPMDQFKHIVKRNVGSVLTDDEVEGL